MDRNPDAEAWCPLPSLPQARLKRRQCRRMAQLGLSPHGPDAASATVWSLQGLVGERAGAGAASHP